MEPASVEAFASAQAQPTEQLPAVQVERYDASYGFNHPGRVAFNAAASVLARGRTLQFMHKYLVG